MRLIDAEKLARNFQRKIWYSKDEVLDAISDAQGVCGWISVKDRLPEDEYECLIANKSGLWIGWFKADEQTWVIDGAICANGFITHWIPLPELPKEDDNE